MRNIKIKPIWISMLILGLVLVLAACSGAKTPEPTQAPVQPEPTQVTCPEAAPCPTQVSNAPFEDLWSNSGHAKADAAAFTHWNDADPKEIPTTCAKCHSDAGFQDYVGADGSAVFAVDKPAAVGSVITCKTCHNDGTAKLTSVQFPSGAEITGLGSEAVCMTCHQGAASMVQVDEAIDKAGLKDVDTVSADLGFTNIHYYAAAVSRYGTEVKGGYQYEGKSYDALFDHATGVQTCTECHNPHSLEVEVDKCSACHTGVKTVDDLHNIRMESSTRDYNGNGNVTEGIYYEVDGLRTMLYQAIQAYAKEVSQTPIVYSADAYPYFFVDTNADGKADADELTVPNGYKSWTARLAKAAFNYQTSIKDPGGYVHGGKYIIELLYDSIDDLNQKLTTPVDLSKASRIDAGHFAGSEEAFRHWDADGTVPNTCVKCHTAGGLPQFLAENTNISMSPSDGLMCETCHNDLTTFTRYEAGAVTFPSGAKLSFVTDGPDDNNLCLNCHQGRESTVSVNKAIGTAKPDDVVDTLGFRNVHYFAAGSTLFGTEAKGIYEYEGKTYLGRFMHVENFATCTSCHDTHALTVNVDSCKGCHQVDDPSLIRAPGDAIDYDGDGNTTEGIAGEVETMNAAVYTALQEYAKTKLNNSIVYSPSAYPYFFVDTNGDGMLDPDEATSANAYKGWTPRLLKGAYNYQYVVKDPGAFAHNGKYVIQVLYDTIQDLGGSVQGMTRPQ